MNGGNGKKARESIKARAVLVRAWADINAEIARQQKIGNFDISDSLLGAIDGFCAADIGIERAGRTE